MKSKSRILSTIIIVILSFLLYLSYLKSSKLHNESNNYELLLKDSVTYYKTKLDQEIATKRNLIVSNKDIKNQKYVADSLLKEITKKFRNVKYAVRIKTDTVYLPVESVFSVPVPCVFERSFSEQYDHYRAYGLVNQSGINVNVALNPVTVRLVSGKKKSFFKTKYTTDVSFDNPMIKVKEIVGQSATERVKRFGIGVFVGLDVKLNPTFGAGFNYSIIRF